MSIKAVLEDYERTSRYIDQIQIKAPYPFVYEMLRKSNKLFRNWLDVYKELGSGYSKEPLTLTQYYVIRWLSISNDAFRKIMKESFEAHIPCEAYILLNYLFSNFEHADISFILAEGSSFEQTTIYLQLQKILNQLSYPRPLAGSSTVDNILKAIRREDVLLIYYERGQYENVLAWPLLLHECFHYISETEGLSRFVHKCPDVPWLHEALIDIYVINFFGPAYARSLISYLQRFPYKESVTHPSFCARILIALQYLMKIEEAGLPVSLSNSVSKTFAELKEMWNKHKSIDALDIQEQVTQIYERAEKSVTQVISKKTKPFLNFLRDVEQERRNAFKITDVKYVEKEVCSISDVIDYFQSGIPIAADPRILFNSFLSEKYRAAEVFPILKIFVVESLKKWYIKQAWLKTKVKDVFS